jgi:hypothetical protein
MTAGNNPFRSQRSLGTEFTHFARTEPKFQLGIQRRPRGWCTINLLKKCPADRRGVRMNLKQDSVSTTLRAGLERFIGVIAARK